MASWGSRKTLRPSSGVGGSLLCSAFNFSTCKQRIDLNHKCDLNGNVFLIILQTYRLCSFFHFYCVCSDCNDVITVVSRRSELNLSSQVAAALRNASCRRISCSTSSTLSPSCLLLINGS